MAKRTRRETAVVVLETNDTNWAVRWSADSVADAEKWIATKGLSGLTYCVARLYPPVTVRHETHTVVRVEPAGSEAEGGE